METQVRLRKTKGNRKKKRREMNKGIEVCMRKSENEMKICIG